MNYWVITDTHFGHKKLVDINSKPIEFETKIIQNIQNCVKAEDIFIHLGDFCIRYDN